MSWEVLFIPPARRRYTKSIDPDQIGVDKKNKLWFNTGIAGVFPRIDSLFYVSRIITLHEHRTLAPVFIVYGVSRIH